LSRPSVVVPPPSLSPSSSHPCARHLLPWLATIGSSVLLSPTTSVPAPASGGIYKTVLPQSRDKGITCPGLGDARAKFLWSGNICIRVSSSVAAHSCTSCRAAAGLLTPIIVPVMRQVPQDCPPALQCYRDLDITLAWPVDDGVMLLL
jgi:hypothetical protein